jgi:hypothetical protein
MADALGGATADWEGGDGPLGNVYKAWHDNGVGSGPAISSLQDPHHQSVSQHWRYQLHHDTRSTRLCSQKAQRVFARALAKFDFAAIVDNVKIDPTVKIRVTVCKGYCASNWLRALPSKETLLLDTQYGIAFALFLRPPRQGDWPAHHMRRNLRARGAAW